MTNKERMESRILETISRLDENYVRKVMVFADTLYEIQTEGAA